MNIEIQKEKKRSLLRDCVTLNSLRAEVAALNVNARNDSHVYAKMKIKVHRGRCQTLLHV